MKENTAGKLIAAVMVCVFFCMLVFNFLTPMVSDDFAHYYGVDGEHIDSLPEIAENLSVLRNTINGRVIPHFFVYLFQMMPRIVFSVVNAAVSVLVLWLLFRYFKEKKDTCSLILLLTAVFMLWYFMPGFGQVFLWLTGSCNYSWGLALDLALIFPFFRAYTCDENAGTAEKFFLPVLACAAGAYSENGAAATIFASGLFTLLLWIKTRKFPVYWFVLCLAECAGFAFLMLAPSEFGGRTGDLSSVGITDSIQNCILLTKKFCMPLFAVYFAALALAVFHKRNRRKIIASAVFFLAGAVSIAVFVFAVYLPQRSFFIMVTFTVLACMILFRELWESDSRKLTLVFAAVMATVFLFSFILGAGDILSLKIQEKKRFDVIESALASGNTNVTLTAYASATMYPAVFDEELTETADGWYNALLARYYGLDSVTGAGINYYFD